MENMILVICTCLSCFIIVSILFQFMDERYNHVFKRKYIYSSIKIVMTIVIAIINVFHNSTLNLFSWIILIGLCVFFLYYEDFDKPIKRIVECEVILLCLVVCESLGVVLADCFLDILHIQIQIDIMKSCLEVTFSKVIVIFIYYMIIAGLMKNKNIPFSGKQYGINFIILIYSFINMFVIAKGLANGQENYILSINMGCIVLADLYLLYFVKVTNEKNYLENELKALEKQANMQYNVIKFR